MPVTVSTTCQSRWKDCCAPSSEVGLTLVSNGEEPVQVYTPARTMVPAGIDTPTVAPTLADGGAGLLPAGMVAYLYVYASSFYPNVSADTAAGGFLWPKGQPSPVSTTYTNTVNHKINVTVGTSQRADIDKILIYRTLISSDTPPDYTSIVATAGQAFYVGFVQNNPAAATVTFTDNTLAGTEELEVDNFAAPQFQFCVYFRGRWYGIGNFDLDVPVTIDATGNLTATTPSFYAGRNGQQGARQRVTFDGITTGGFDGKGTFYYRYNGSSLVATVSVSDDLSTQDFPGYNGTTVMHVRGFAGTLYRSKTNNPFAWGYTEYQVAGDSQVRVTQQFAQVIGGYAVALCVLPQQQLLKIDCERPSRCYSLDVSVPLETNFNNALKLLDSRYIVTSHFSQFLSLLSSGQTGLRGIDTSNFAVVQSDSGGQVPISDAVQDTLRKAITGDSSRKFHGVFDSDTELSCFWFKTANDPFNALTIDTALLYHGPSGQWSILRELDITASASVYDPATLQNITLVGTASGQICQAFAKDVFWNIHPGSSDGPVNITELPGKERYTVTIPSIVNANGKYFDIPYSPTKTCRFYFHIVNPIGPALPPAPERGFLIPVNYTPLTPASLAGKLVATLIAFGFTDAARLSNVVTFSAINGGILPDPSSGTSSVTISKTEPLSTLGTSQFGLSSSFSVPPQETLVTPTYLNTWVLLCDKLGQNEVWARYVGVLYYRDANGAQKFGGDFDLFFNPETRTVSDSPDGYAPLGYYAANSPVNCEAQTYFQPSENVSGQRVEVWANQSEVSATSNWSRIYSEWDDTVYQSPFRMVQTKRGDGVALSNNWMTANQVPTGLMAQFGFRLIDRGFGNFTLRSFTLAGK